MKLHEWKTRFAPQILRRGEDYYADDALDSLKWDGETVTATVWGTEKYTVEIDITDGRVDGMYCSCPYAEEDNCKHMAAVLFAVSEDDFPAHEQQPQRTDDTSLKDAVESLSAPDMRALLWKFVRKYPDIAEQVMLKSAGRVTDAQIEAWEKQIASLAKKYADRDGYIEYRDARSYIRDLKVLLREKVPVLLECAMPWEAFELTRKVLSEASGADMDDSDGGVGGLWWTCAEHWKAILPRMTLEERHKMFDWFETNYRRWAVSNEILDNFLFGDSAPDAAFSEPEFLRRKLELLDAQIEKASEDSYEMRNYISYRLDTMKKLSMNPDEIERYMWEHYKIQSVRERLVEEAIQENRLEDAVKILSDSKKIDAKRPGLVDEYSEKLIELYRQLNRTEELRAELMFLIGNAQQQNLRYVKMLKDITPQEQWSELRERLLPLKTLSWVRGEILEMDGLYERLFRYATSGKSMVFMDKFAGILGEKYPKETLKFYVDCLREEMKGATQKNYRELVKRLKRLGRLPGGEEAATRIAQEWRTTYYRRRSLLQELKNQGF